MKPLVIYHANCADGFGAAFAAWLKFGEEAEYLPMQYGKEITEASEDGLLMREVYILDFSFPRDQMEHCFQYAKRVIWLDHHKTAFEMWHVDSPYNHKGFTVFMEEKSHIILDNNKSGALLAWEYFHPGKEVPMFIKHIDDYDRWQFKLEGTKEFNKALWSYAPWDFRQWKYLLAYDAPTIRAEKMRMLYAEGAAILRAHDANVQAVVKGAGRECNLPGTVLTSENTGSQTIPVMLKGLAANCPPHLASDVGHELANASGTYGLLWFINKEGKCLCSLRSNGDYDVSATAKAFGGGGHKNAAGFEVPIEQLLEWIK